MNSVSIKCLEELAERRFSFYSGMASDLIHSKEGEYRKLEFSGYCAPMPEEQLETLEYFGANDNINDLACAGSYVRMKDRGTGEDIIQYFCPLELPPMKYIILSATLNANIYRKYFGGKMEVYSYSEKKAAYKGKLQQYTYHSHKLKGRNLAVIGTPYSVDENYKLIACYLGADMNQKEDKAPKFRRVSYKGSSFPITTYKEPLLQEVQLHSVESELELPREQAELHTKDYLA